MTTLSAQEYALFRQLLDEAACRNLLQRYSKVVDWKDWDALPDLCWPDAQFDFGMWSGDFPAFAPWVQALEDGYQRRLHLFCIQQIQVEGDRARAEVGMTNHLRLVDENGAGKDDLLFGRYHFTLACRDASWKILGLRFFMHGAQRFDAGDQGGAPWFADNLDPGHPHFFR